MGVAVTALQHREQNMLHLVSVCSTARNSNTKRHREERVGDEARVIPPHIWECRVS